jgi:thiol-disulfide isomerase/thioredoxin
MFRALLLSAGFIAAPFPLMAQDGKPNSVAVSDDKSKEKDAEKKEDKFAVPTDASPADLLAWIAKTKRLPPPRDAMAETALKMFPALIQACDLVIEKSQNADELKKAIEEKFSAYSVLVRFLPSATKDLDALAEKYATDSNPEIAQIAVGHTLMEKAQKLGDADAAKAQEVSDATVAFLDRFGVNKGTFSTVSRVASSLGYSSHYEIAAVAHEKIASMLEKSKDETLAKRSSKLLGAARRIRLPGSEMLLTGVTADGIAFDWESYRGKVVLVDYWASWCGPCIGEIPNMKKNLERFGNKGFTIVGINMDDTREAFEKCVENKEITWTNIVSEEEGKRGWDAPMADYYGITGIPTAILVDQKGKVVSLRARGVELDKMLESLLGSE